MPPRVEQKAKGRLELDFETWLATRKYKDSKLARQLYTTEVIEGVWDVADASAAVRNAFREDTESSSGGLQSTGMKPSPANPEVSTDPSTINLPGAPTHDPSSTPQPPTRPTTSTHAPTPIELRNEINRQLDGLSAFLTDNARNDISDRLSEGTFAVDPAVVEDYNSHPVEHWNAVRDYQANYFRAMMMKAMDRGFDVRLADFVSRDGKSRAEESFSVRRQYADGTELVGEDVSVFDELNEAYKRYTKGVSMLTAVEHAALMAAVAEGAADTDTETLGEEE